MKNLLLVLSLFLLIYACGKDSEAGPPPSSDSSNNSKSTTEPEDVRHNLYFRIFTILKKHLYDFP